ncbi:DUF6153 family protein [Streptomyces sp. NPDC056160]|uniref:DUF6153 family protein n=1 Tax=Streptomyces sp. NPDC056160 TaxID=3345731 RepID=UPI0035DEDF17
MTSGARTRSSQRRARRMLLVLAVLAGVLAMHGLAPGGMSAPGHHGAMTPQSAMSHQGARGPQGATAAPARSASASAHSLSVRSMPSVGSVRSMPSVRSVRSVPVPRAGDACRHLSDRGPGGTAAQHADGTCAAAGTSTGYTPPAPLPTPAPAAAPPAALRAGPGARAVDGRAPPDLSELQLLRI